MFTESRKKMKAVGLCLRTNELKNGKSGTFKDKIRACSVCRQKSPSLESSNIIPGTPYLSRFLRALCGNNVTPVHEHYGTWGTTLLSRYASGRPVKAAGTGLVPHNLYDSWQAKNVPAPPAQSAELSMVSQEPQEHAKNMDG